MEVSERTYLFNSVILRAFTVLLTVNHHVQAAARRLSQIIFLCNPSSFSLKIRDQVSCKKHFGKHLSQYSPNFSPFLYTGSQTNQQQNSPHCEQVASREVLEAHGTTGAQIHRGDSPKVFIFFFNRLYSSFPLL